MAKTKLSDFKNELDVECKPEWLKLPNGKRIVVRIPIKANIEHIDYIYNLYEKEGYESGDALTPLMKAFPELSDEEAKRIFFLFMLTIPS